MLERRDVDISTKLDPGSTLASFPVRTGAAQDSTHILFDVLLTLLDSGLTKLRRHLCRRVVHELPVSSKYVPARATLLLIRVPSLSSCGKALLLLLLLLLLL